MARKVDLEALYTLLGKEGSAPIDERSCDTVDCLHPCYGEDLMGYCMKCLQMHAENGERHGVCDMCTL